MLNNASKFAIGVVPLAAIAAIFADDRAAALVLVGVAVAAAIVAFGIGTTVGADVAPFASADAAPASTAVEPTDVGAPSFGPLLAAVGVTVGVAGGALGPDWVLAGGLFAVVGLATWLFDLYRTPGVLAARDTANIDNRFIGPLALPVAAFLVAITIAYSFSRVLLAVNETASWVVAFIVAAALFALLFVIAEKAPKTKVLSALAGAGAIATLATGGVFAGIGEREFHHAGEELPTVEITAKDVAFDRTVMALPLDREVEMIFNNLDVGVFHNVAIYTNEEPGTPVYSGRPSAKGVLTYKFRTPDELGTYRFICDFHPTMVGELRITEAVAETSEHGEESDHGSTDESEHETESSDGDSEKESEH